ncbi:regulator of microtubule dynamics protein 1 isoform X1 [Monodelphis domestica]|uniref:regulator of microtubule dynamics protein 1 isoform X1 n=1 Tax=Monodelphis domestica TaxID=13616 RepID=UPI0024E25A99|nr:regulator of microtubule dynamics protein 1 isoform X1 [Monodelphis domestica]
MALAAQLRRLLPSLRRGIQVTAWAQASGCGRRGGPRLWLDGSEVHRPPPLGWVSKILGNAVVFKKGLIISALSYLGFETFQLISQSAVVHAEANVEEILEQADYLYGSGEIKKLYQLLAKYKKSEDAELLWRLARASRDISQLSTTSKQEKKQLVYEAFEYAKKALQKNNSSFAAHKWYAICLSDIGDYEGIKVKIGNAFIIKKHLEKAIELNPKDATSIHIIGIWCFSFAEMPWVQRKIAKTLFATPPTSTFEEALKYFQMAEKANPNFYSKNLLYLGKTYLKLKNKKLAALWLLKAKDYPAHTEEDKQVQKEAVQLLKSIGDKN